MKTVKLRLYDANEKTPASYDTIVHHIPWTDIFLLHGPGDGCAQSQSCPTMKGQMSTHLVSSKEELKILRSERLHGSIIRVDCGVDHTGLLLLKKYHATFDGILDAKSSNGTRSRLSNAVASVSRLPLRGGIPPTEQRFIST